MNEPELRALSARQIHTPVEDDSEISAVRRAGRIVQWKLPGPAVRLVEPVLQTFR